MLYFNLLSIPSTLHIIGGFVLFHYKDGSVTLNANNQQGEPALYASSVGTAALVEEVEFSPGFSSSPAACASAGEEELL